MFVKWDEHMSYRRHRVPPLQRTQGRGTHSRIIGEETKTEGRATLYNRVGVVKRHVDQRRVLVFPFVEGFGVALGVAFAFAHATKARFQNRAVEAWFHQPSIRSLPFRP